MGFDRPTARWWRWIVAAMLAIDAIVMASMTALRVHQAPGSIRHESLGAWLAGEPFALAALALLGTLAAWRFGTGPGRWAAALLALIPGRLLLEANGYIHHDYLRNFYYSGAMIAAWAGGILYARALGVPKRAHDTMDRYGAIAAATILGAIYANAGLSKLLYAGLEWTDPDVLRVTAFMYHPVAPDSWTRPLYDALMESPALAGALGIGAIVIELSGVLIPINPRLRALAGAALLALHLGMILFLRIAFIEGIALLALLCFPWPHWLKLRVRTEPEAAWTLPTDWRHRWWRVVMVTGAVIAAIALYPSNSVLRSPQPAQSGSVAAPADDAPITSESTTR